MTVADLIAADPNISTTFRAGVGFAAELARGAADHAAHEAFLADRAMSWWPRTNAGLTEAQIDKRAEFAEDEKRDAAMGWMHGADE